MTLQSSLPLPLLFGRSRREAGSYIPFCLRLVCELQELVQRVLEADVDQIGRHLEEPDQLGPLLSELLERLDSLSQRLPGFLKLNLKTSRRT